MDRGTDMGAPGLGAAVEAVARIAAAPIPLAVVLVDRDGLVSHWSAGAQRVFGVPEPAAVGHPATDLLPVSGALPDEDEREAEREAEYKAEYEAEGESESEHGDWDWDDRWGEEETSPFHGPYDGLGPGLGPSLGGRTAYPTAGRARVPTADPCRGDRIDVLWWAYPLVGPGDERLLVLAADAAQLWTEGDGRGPAVDRVTPVFAFRTDVPGTGELARGLPGILPGLSPGDSARIVAQVRELGFPVLEFSRHERVPVTPDWGVPRDAPVEQECRKDEEAERLAFLDEFGARIGSSLDLARTVDDVGKAVVPDFADVAGVYLREQVVAGEEFPDGVPDPTTLWHRVAVEHTGERGPWDSVVPVGESVPIPAHTPFLQCLTTGEPVLVPRIGARMEHRIAERFEKRDIRPLITGRSMLVLPLKAREATLGFMILLRHPHRAEFTQTDRRTGAQLATRAGLVLDNARMRTYRENVAETLQDSLLPHLPSHLTGCDLATRRLPGSPPGRAGGDWFDAVQLPGSRTAFTVGDVLGRGLGAVATMGQLRAAVQAMAGLDLPPAQLLRRLDDLARRLGGHSLATCLYVVYDPLAGELRIANAGHVPPVLIRAGDGRGELLPLPTGVPIGVGGMPFGSLRVRVSPGDRLVLCTDGLVETRGTGTGLAALCESAAHPAASMDDACDGVIRALGKARDTSGGRDDDVALLMARLGGIAPADIAEWRLAFDPVEVGRARAVVRDRLHDWGLGALADTVTLLVGELVTNAVRHAQGRYIGLRLVRGHSLLCEIADAEPSLPVLLDAGPAAEFGRGMRVVDSLAREWGASRTDTGKTVWFELAAPGRN